MARRVEGDRANAAFEAARHSRYWSEAEARGVLAAYRVSGLSLRAFARQTGLSARRVRWWRERMVAPPAAGAAFLPVEVVPAKATAVPALEVVVGGGHVVRVPRDFDAATLTRLLAVLAGPPC